MNFVQILTVGLLISFSYFQQGAFITKSQFARDAQPRVEKSHAAGAAQRRTAVEIEAKLGKIYHNIERIIEKLPRSIVVVRFQEQLVRANFGEQPRGQRDYPGQWITTVVARY